MPELTIEQLAAILRAQGPQITAPPGQALGVPGLSGMKPVPSHRVQTAAESNRQMLEQAKKRSPTSPKQAVQNALADAPDTSNLSDYWNHTLGSQRSSQPQVFGPGIATSTYSGTSDYGIPPALANNDTFEQAGGTLRPGAPYPEDFTGSDSIDVPSFLRPNEGSSNSTTPPKTGGMSTQDWLGIAGLGAGALGSYLTAKQQGGQFDQNVDLEKQRIALQEKQLAQNMDIAKMGDLRSRQIAGLDATQLNPYKQQDDLYSMALKRALGEFGPAQVQMGSSTPLDPGKGARADAARQFLNDQALGNAASNFEKARLDVNPTGTPLNLSGTGLKGVSNLDSDLNTYKTSLTNPATTPAPNTQKSAVDAALSNYADLGDKYANADHQTDDELEKMYPTEGSGYHWHNHELSEDGSGFWHKAAKYGGIAGAGVATAMTGGAAAPWLVAAIGAGSGAASGWGSGGGTKAALLGAGMGAAPGAMMGVSNPALRAGINAGIGTGGAMAQGADIKSALLAGGMNAGLNAIPGVGAKATPAGTTTIPAKQALMNALQDKRTWINTGINAYAGSRR